MTKADEVRNLWKSCIEDVDFGDVYSPEFLPDEAKKILAIVEDLEAKLEAATVLLKDLALDDGLKLMKEQRDRIRQLINVDI